MAAPTNNLPYQTDNYEEYIAYLHGVLEQVFMFSSKSCQACRVMKGFAGYFRNHMELKKKIELNSEQRKQVFDIIQSLTKAAYKFADSGEKWL